MKHFEFDYRGTECDDDLGQLQKLKCVSEIIYKKFVLRIYFECSYYFLSVVMFGFTAWLIVLNQMTI